MAEHRYPRPEWLTQTQCEGKYRFESAPLARKVAARSSQRHDTPMAAYHCPVCGGWHVGGSKGKRPNKRKDLGSKK